MMEFDLIDNFKLVIERIGKNKYKVVLLDPARKPFPVRTLGRAFWVDWVRSNSFLAELGEKVGCDPEALKTTLGRIGSDIELKGKKILEPPAPPKKELEKAEGDITSKPTIDTKKAELEEYERTVKEIRGKDVYSELIPTFEKTIKKDKRSVEFIFTHLLSAYSPDPSNLGIGAPTSEGKTYPTVEVANHFPKEDVWFLGGLSPTALIHSHSELVGKDDKPIEAALKVLTNQINLLKKAGEKGEADLAAAKDDLAELVKNSKYLVDMENKILIFLEAPQLETWEKIRPILSHDVYEISYKFTDKTSGGRLKTSHVIIRGWPAAVYLKAGKGREDVIWPQIQSRFTTISPRMSAEKYRAAVEFSAMRKGLPSVVFDHKIGAKEFERAERIIRTIRHKLLDIKYNARRESNSLDPNTFWIPFYKEIGKEFPASVGRHMRDSKRFITTMQMSAATNVFARPILKMGDTENIVVVKEDYERAIRLYFEEGGEEIFTGIPAHVIDFFKRVILPLWRRGEPEHEQIDGKKAEDTTPREGITVAKMVDKCKGVYHKGVSSNTIRQHYLPYLENYGQITSDPDPNNKSQKLWSVLQEKMRPKDTHIHTLFKSGGGFTPEMLKRELNDLNATPPHEPIIHNNYGKTINADQLWGDYYHVTDSGGGVGLRPEQAPTEERREKNTHKTEKGVSGGVLEKNQKVERTAQDLEKSILSLPKKTRHHEDKIAEDLGVSVDRVRVVLGSLGLRGAVIPRGGRKWEMI